MSAAKKKRAKRGGSKKVVRARHAKRTAVGRKKPTATQLPDLGPILDAYLDAHAIIHTASYAIHNGDDNDQGLATATLRQGVEALDAANDRLEEVEMQLHRLREGSKS
jgi:hypothetical protein